MSTTKQEFGAPQAWLPPEFDKQDLRNAMGLLLTRVKGLEERLAGNKPFDEFARYDQDISMLRSLANDANKELAKIPTLENQVKVLTAQNARLQDEMRVLRKEA